MPSSAPAALTRRRFLAASAGVVGLAVSTGCAAPGTDTSPDPVLEMIRSAQRDAREFAAADASHGAYVDALRRTADVRRIHAERLGELVDHPQETAPAEPGTAAPAPAYCPPVEEVRTRLRADAGRASEVAVGSDGIRAELTGAVSAACTAALEVLLP